MYIEREIGICNIMFVIHTCIHEFIRMHEVLVRVRSANSPEEQAALDRIGLRKGKTVKLHFRSRPLVADPLTPPSTRGANQRGILQTRLGSY